LLFPSLQKSDVEIFAHSKRSEKSNSPQKSKRGNRPALKSKERHRPICSLQKDRRRAICSFSLWRKSDCKKFAISLFAKRGTMNESLDSPSSTRLFFDGKMSYYYFPFYNNDSSLHRQRYKNHTMASTTPGGPQTAGTEHVRFSSASKFQCTSRRISFCKVN